MVIAASEETGTVSEDLEGFEGVEEGSSLVNGGDVRKLPPSPGSLFCRARKKTVLSPPSISRCPPVLTHGETEADSHCV